MAGEGLALMEKRLTVTKAGPGKVGFDPAIISLIISTIIPIIQGCFKPTPQALRRKFLNRARVAAGLVQNTGQSWSDAFDQSDELFDLAREAKDEELQLLIDDCIS